MIPSSTCWGLREVSTSSILYDHEAANGSKDLQSTSNGNEAELHSSMSQKRLLSDQSPRRGGTYNKLMIVPGQLRRFKLNSSISLCYPSAKFQQISKEWIKSPLNMVLLLWITCVTISGAILFLVMTGMLNHVLPDKTHRNIWFEANNQILNALFTLMCLYQHPKRLHHLILLCRWNTKDVFTLRNTYCKNGTHKPHEWAHMMVVVLLLHVNCLSQYALCGLNLGYKRDQRPAIGVAICLSIAIAAPLIAAIYCIVSPLGKEYGSSEVDEQLNEKTTVELVSQWKGGTFDLVDDVERGCLSLFCGFCVFGWNMERLGLGNMYVHIATFILFCTAPFWIFYLAAKKVEDLIVREALGITGIVLCVFGLLYGGFWRIQMRKRFNLPGNNCFGGKPAVVDCAVWLFCWWCALAQEVRTADFYYVQRDDHSRPALSLLPRENGMSVTSQLGNNETSLSFMGKENSSNPKRFSNDSKCPDRRLLSEREVNIMKPPASSAIKRDDN